jgi:hypothetical protein
MYLLCVIFRFIRMAFFQFSNILYAFWEFKPWINRFYRWFNCTKSHGCLLSHQLFLCAFIVMNNPLRAVWSLQPLVRNFYRWWNFPKSSFLALIWLVNHLWIHLDDFKSSSVCMLMTICWSVVVLWIKWYYGRAVFYAIEHKPMYACWCCNVETYIKSKTKKTDTMQVYGNLSTS